GIVMYELLTGKHPFAAESFSRLVQRILNEDPPDVRGFRADVPEALVRILNHALAKDRSQRYTMGLELASDLSQAFDVLLETPREHLSEQERFAMAKDLDFFEGFPDTEVWEIVRAGNWQD